MNHGGMDHGGMDMGPRCAMHMLWNTQIIDTCIVFSWWHVSSKWSFALSFLAILLLGVAFEYLRALQRAFDRRLAASVRSKSVSRDRSRSRDSTGELVSAEEEYSQEAGLLTGRHAIKTGLSSGMRLSPGARIVRAVLYGATVFLSFFLMLVFMTYNAYLIIAVVLGAAIGHYLCGTHMDLDLGADSKGIACH